MGTCVNLRIDLRHLETKPQILVREEDGGPVAYLVIDAPGVRVSFCISRTHQAEQVHELLADIGARLSD